MNNTNSLFVCRILAIGAFLANLDSINASPASESNNPTEKCPPGVKCIDFSEIPQLRQEWLDAHPEESSTETSTPTSSDNEMTAETSDSDTETPATTPSSETYIPSLSCILFKELGCDVQCTIAGSLIGISDETVGTCDTSLACICTTPTASLDDLWNAKFISNEVLEKIKLDKKLAQKVTKCMRNTAFQTAEQSKFELESLVPESLFERIQLIRDSSEINQETSDSEYLEVVKDYVDTLVGPKIKESRYFDTTASNLNWVENYFDFLNQNKHNPSIRKVYHQTRLTEDDYLQGRLDFFLQNKGVLKEYKNQKYPQDSTMQQIAINRVINRMMNEIGIPKSFDPELESSD